MRITSVSCFGHMLYEHYIKKAMPMGENKVIQILSRNPVLINCLKGNSFHPIVRKYSNNPFK